MIRVIDSGRSLRDPRDNVAWSQFDDFVGVRKPLTARAAVAWMQNGNLMGDDSGLIDVFLSLEPNQPRDENTRESFRQSLRQRLEERLPEAVERIWKLPAIILKEPRKEYVGLLLEARELFVQGQFYSCVAMCGIVGERLIKDALRAAVLIEQGGQVCRPSERAFDQLERVEVGGILRFLKETGHLSPEASKAADQLSQLRNGYAHARGKNPGQDAIEAIEHLHALVEGTVSMFKDFEIKNGAFVRKRPAPNLAGDGS
jgi:hypothetical protein